MEKKLRFALTVEGDWPPVGTESVWCSVEGDVYVLQNAPFFIEGLAWGDKFRAVPDPVNDCVFDFSLVEPSGHSLVWVLTNAGGDFSLHKAQLQKLGCRIEGFPTYDLWSVDVPPTVSESEMDAQLNKIEGQGFAVAVPVWRYG